MNLHPSPPLRGQPPQPSLGADPLIYRATPKANSKATPFYSHKDAFGRERFKKLLHAHTFTKSMGVGQTFCVLTPIFIFYIAKTMFFPIFLGAQSAQGHFAPKSTKKQATRQTCENFKPRTRKSKFSSCVAVATSRIKKEHLCE